MNVQKLMRVLMITSAFSLGAAAEPLLAEGRDLPLKVSLSVPHVMTTFDGENIAPDPDKITHLVFMNLWDSYEGAGAERDIAALPADFLQDSQQIWVQPELNVTHEQLKEFQQGFPQVMPLILDKSYRMMRDYGVWQLPYHVLLKGKEAVFAGDSIALKTYLNVPSVKVESASAEPQISSVPTQPFQKVMAGDMAPLFQGTTLLGKSLSLQAQLKNSGASGLSLVFLDALCPMPHFPECEAKLATLNKQMAASTSRQWIGVVNSYYVDQSVARQFAKSFELKLPLIFDADNRIFQQYGVHATPYQIDITAQGRVDRRGPDIR